MPMGYDNTTEPFYSEVERNFNPALDISPYDEMSVWFFIARGSTLTANDRVFLGIEDSDGKVFREYVEPSRGDTERWLKIALELADADLDLASINKLSVGVGNPDNPKPGGAGQIFIDDIRVSKPEPVEEDYGGVKAEYFSVWVFSRATNRS